ncbi:MAG: hypothetical protein NVS4B3_19640 [Gemmatimonadaceae bacterium]
MPLNPPQQSAPERIGPVYPTAGPVSSALLAAALRRMISSSREETNALRAAVRALVVEARERGVTPERTLVVAKQLVGETEGLSSWIGDSRALTARVAQWVIADYFRDD